MSLLKKMLNGLENKQNVWEKHEKNIYAPIEDYNKNSKFTYLGSVVDNDLGRDSIYCPLYSRVGDERIANINVYDELKIAEFLDVLEESSRTLEAAKKENQLSPRNLMELEFDLKEGLETLYKSLDVENMKKIISSMEVAFSGLSKRGEDPLYRFFKENSAKWLEEKVASAGV